jgi:hypothetical protein
MSSARGGVFQKSYPHFNTNGLNIVGNRKNRQTLGKGFGIVACQVSEAINILSISDSNIDTSALLKEKEEVLSDRLALLLVHRIIENTKILMDNGFRYETPFPSKVLKIIGRFSYLQVKKNFK